MIDHAGNFGVNIAAAEFFGAHDFAGGGFHQWRAAKENGALIAHDDGFIGHRGDISATCGTGPHDHSNLWDALGAHGRLIVKNASEMVAVWEDLILQREESAAGIDQINAWQAVFAGDVLSAKVFFDRHRSRCRL